MPISRGGDASPGRADIRPGGFSREGKRLDIIVIDGGPGFHAIPAEDHQTVTQRVMDILQGLPLLVLALVMSAVLGPSLGNVIIAISVPIIPRAARVIRSSVLAIREMPYVEAARALGVNHSRVAFRHILPNTMGVFIVLITAQLGSAILVEAALSFLGLGVPEPYPSWGRMLSVSAAEYAQKAPGLVLFPGVAISLAVFGTNLLGDALRDVLDPRLRQA